MDLHNRAKCTLEGVTNVSVPETAGVYRSMKVSNQFDINLFQRKMKIKITDMPNDNFVAFDLKGVDPPVANALRRICLSEVPTVAIEQVDLWQNTGVLHDEVLVHRLGLIPLNVDADALDWRGDHEEMNSKNSVMFRLHVKCTDGTRSVYASDMEWKIIDDSQTNKFEKVPAPVYGDILITKLRPGQEIECEMFAIKGVGKDHAKWSPVSTAWYRMAPEIVLKHRFEGSEAQDLVKVCPVGVFDIEDNIAVAANPRNCTTCRACLEKFGDKVEVNKIKNQFLFTIESVGSLPSCTIFQRAIHILKMKMSTALEILSSTKD